ncbi:MAG: hypothetical protein KAI76_01960 [Alphaproteobacteria bacterium]|nr:hypothetical protein [Alphaproteobacteria bacterium]
MFFIIQINIHCHPRFTRGSGSASARLMTNKTAGLPTGCPREAGMTTMEGS